MSINFNDIDSKTDASQIYWRWLLKKVQLNPINAGLHGVYQRDSAAVFFDLDGDGVDEILATHYSTASSGMGECLLYILKKSNDRYKEISQKIYFNPAIPVYILPQKTNGFRDIEVNNLLESHSHIWVYDKKKELYIKKSEK